MESLGRSSARMALRAGNCDNVNVMLVVNDCWEAFSVEMLRVFEFGELFKKEKEGVPWAGVGAVGGFWSDAPCVRAFNCAMMASLRAASARSLLVTVCEAATLRRSNCTDSAVGTFSVGG